MFDIDSAICSSCFEAVPFDPDGPGEFVGDADGVSTTARASTNVATATNTTPRCTDTPTKAPRKTCR